MRAVSPSRVKMAVPLPYWCALTSASARVEVGYSHHAQHRAEDFFLIDAHVGGDLVEQAAAEIEAVGVRGNTDVAAIDHQVGAFGDAKVHVAAHLLVVLPGDQGTHLGTWIARRADLEGRDARRQALDQGFGGVVADHDRHRYGHAALAGRAVGGSHQGVGGLVEIGVGHHHHVVLGTTQGLHTLAVVGAGPVDVLGHRGRADEAHRGYVGVGEQGVDRLPVAVDHVEHARRQDRPR